MDERYVALYRSGDCSPIGILNKDCQYLMLEELNRKFFCYWTKEITPEQARQIAEDLKCQFPQQTPRTPESPLATLPTAAQVAADIDEERRLHEDKIV